MFDHVAVAHLIFISLSLSAQNYGQTIILTMSPLCKLNVTLRVALLVWYPQGIELQFYLKYAGPFQVGASGPVDVRVLPGKSFSVLPGGQACASARKSSEENEESQSRGKLERRQKEGKVSPAFHQLSLARPFPFAQSIVLPNVYSTGWKKTDRSRGFTVSLFIKIINITIVIKSNYRYHKKRYHF